MKRLAVLAFAVAAAFPAQADAGTYHVYTCAAGGRVHTNQAWRAANVRGVVEDTSCSGGVIGLTVPAGARMADNTSSALTFTAPRGTTIADFTLTRQLHFDAPVAEKTHRYFLLYSLGATHFAGAGNFADGTRDALNAQKAWYGYPERNVNVARSTVTRGSFRALDAYGGDATQLILRAGCYRRGSPCSVATGGAISHLLTGADVTISDPTPPSTTVEAAGLLAGGARDGSDPVYVTASDGAGIRRVELFDVTDPTLPALVGVEDYTQGRTDRGRACDFSRPAPCPNLNGEAVVPTGLPAGERRVLVRVTDTGGNLVDNGPYVVYARTPSNRGVLNGVNATNTATISATWTKGGDTRRRTVPYRKRAGIRVRLRNSAGAPIAGARVVFITKDVRRGAKPRQRRELVTGADGSAFLVVRASASRLLQFAWRSHTNDATFSANAYLVLQARARATLHVSTRRPRVGRRLAIRGRLKGVKRRGVPVIVQGRARGTRRWSTFADTTTSRSGRFKVHYRFRSGASRGKRFQFRARIRRAPFFPYRTGYSRRVTVRVR
ncbi:MAG TPA: hypothetical protein VFG79_06925 [Solirubrobacter sp.]|nr:hypothetical protein [Solirubrobacter sp.]